MSRKLRPRWLAYAGLASSLLFALAACSGNYPNSTFQPTTEFNRDVTSLWDSMMFWGTIVFVLVEALLIYAIFRYRRRPDTPEPRHVHGNTVLEIAWTLLPAVILVFIAVPTVRTIFRTQAPAAPGALQIEVIGHQWWWEFKYPQYDVSTANEIYLPVGRTVSFALRTADVLHSFWIPALGGKRDLIANKTNYLWFTPDSTGVNAFNGSCNEFCGPSHAFMKFRAFTVDSADFTRWIDGQRTTAVFPPPPPDSAAPATPATPAPSQVGAASNGASNPASNASGTNGSNASAAIVPVSNVAQAAQTAPSGAAGAQTPAAAPPGAPPFTFPRDRLPNHTIPNTPIPAGVSISDAVIARGDAKRGYETYSRAACIGCHRIRGNRMSIGVIGPDLTHIGSRHTLAAGVFPNDAKHLAHWLKNARLMKPGVLMQTLGKGEYDPILKTRVTVGGLTDEQIADIVAYLHSLK